jgi:hypothetical protein
MLGKQFFDWTLMGGSYDYSAVVLKLRGMKKIF